MTILKTTGTLILGTYLGLTTLVSGQSKVPVNGRILIDGKPAGQNEKVIIYKKIGNDTLKTTAGGYINGTTTEVEKEKKTEEIKTTVWITPEGILKNATDIKEAKLYDATKREITNEKILENIINGKRFIPHLASGIYLIHVQEKNETYMLKFALVDQNIRGASQHQKTTLITKPETTKNTLYKTLDITVIDSIKVLESNNIVEKTFPGISTTSNTINLGDLNVQGKVTVSGVAEGVHPDSTRAYKLPNATVNIYEISGDSDDIYEMMIVNPIPIATGNTNNNAEFSIRVPKINKENTYYAIEIVANNHHKKMLEVGEKNAYLDPIMYQHIYSGKTNENKKQQILSDIIDQTYFYWVTINGDLATKVRGGPLAKWDADNDGYSRLKTWIQPGHPLSDKAKKYCIDDWAGEGDAGIIQSQTTDSTQANILIKFLSATDPKLYIEADRYANGTYDVKVDYTTDTIKKVMIYISESIMTSVFEDVREGVLKEEYRQGTLDLHDISIYPYYQYFYGSAKLRSNIRPGEFENNNIHKPLKMLEKGF